MSQRFTCSDPDERKAGIASAVRAIQAGELVVLPTDTVYGVGADAFDPDAVAGLLVAKGRGRDKPPPVLIGNVSALDGVATDIPDAGRRLVDEFWPGALTIVCHEQPSLIWDLGAAEGTVAVRMPDHELTRELLDETGPLAVSSANVSGQEAARTADEAFFQLEEKVEVYLNGGPSSGSTPSTIVDLTSEVPRLLREGAISLERLREVVPELADLEGRPGPGGAAEPEGADSADSAESAGSTDSAGSGGIADSADSADKAGSADGADRMNGTE